MAMRSADVSQFIALCDEVTDAIPSRPPKDSSLSQTISLASACDNASLEIATGFSVEQSAVSEVVPVLRLNLVMCL